MNLTGETEAEFRAVAQHFLQKSKDEEPELSPDSLALFSELGGSKDDKRDKEPEFYSVASFKEQYLAAEQVRRPKMAASMFRMIARYSRSRKGDSFSADPRRFEMWKEVEAIAGRAPKTLLTYACNCQFIGPALAHAIVDGVAPNSFALPKAADKESALQWATHMDSVDFAAHFAALVPKTGDAVHCAIRDGNAEMADMLLSAGKHSEKLLEHHFNVPSVAMLKVFRKHGVSVCADYGLAAAWAANDAEMEAILVAEGMKPNHSCLDAMLKAGRLDRMGDILAGGESVTQWLATRTVTGLVEYGHSDKLIEFLDSKHGKNALKKFKPKAHENTPCRELVPIGKMLDETHDKKMFDALFARGIPPEAIAYIEDEDMFLYASEKFIGRDGVLPDNVWKAAAYIRGEDEKYDTLGTLSKMVAKVPLDSALEIISKPESYSDDVSLDVAKRTDWRDKDGLSVSGFVGRNNMEICRTVVERGGKFDLGSVSYMHSYPKTREMSDLLFENSTGKIDITDMANALKDGAWVFVQSALDSGKLVNGDEVSGFWKVNNLSKIRNTADFETAKTIVERFGGKDPWQYIPGFFRDPTTSRLARHLFDTHIAGAPQKWFMAEFLLLFGGDVAVFRHAFISKIQQRNRRCVGYFSRQLCYCRTSLCRVLNLLPAVLIDIRWARCCCARAVFHCRWIWR